MGWLGAAGKSSSGVSHHSWSRRHLKAQLELIPKVVSPVICLKLQQGDGLSISFSVWLFCVSLFGFPHSMVLLVKLHTLQGCWCPRWRISTDVGRSCQTCLDLALEVTWCHFSHILSHREVKGPNRTPGEGHTRIAAGSSSCRQDKTEVKS